MSPSLAGAGALALWAFLAPLATLAKPAPPLLVTALGLGVGGLLGLAVVVARGRVGALRLPLRAWAHGVGGIGGYHALYFAALALAPTVEANLINYLWPLLIVLLTAPLRGLPLGPRRLAGVGLGALGAIVLLAGEARFPPGALPGLLCAAAAAVTWATYSVLAGRWPDTPTEGVAGFCLVAAALAGAAHLAFEPPAALGPRQAVAILLLGTGPLGAAFYLWDVGMKRGDPRLLGSLAYAVPVASTLLLLALEGGEVSGRLVAAVGLVVGGGALAGLAKPAGRGRGR